MITQLSTRKISELLSSTADISVSMYDNQLCVCGALISRKLIDSTKSKFGYPDYIVEVERYKAESNLKTKVGVDIEVVEDKVKSILHKKLKCKRHMNYNNSEEPVFIPNRNISFTYSYGF